MAGQTSNRKQWRLFRGPKGNIQSLGWAEFGCPESQVKLARELLEETDEESVDKDEKCRLGVYWLLKASEKGHEEATELLQECLASGKGITEQNLSDVRACLDMPQGEKLSREAAKELFSSLSQGESYITSNQLLREIGKFSEGPFPASLGMSPEWSSNKDQVKNERLTEDMILTAGSQHLSGELPGILKDSLARVSPLGVSTCHLARLPLLPHPLLILSFVTLFGIDCIIDAAPFFLYYGSLIVMVLSTCQILLKKWEFNTFRQWSHALVACGCTEEVSTSSQWAHCSQNARPFLVFTSSLVINLVSSCYVPSAPYSEIATLSTLLSLYLLYNFSWKNRKIDSMVVITFIIHLVARYPYEIDEFVYYYWRYLDVHVPTFTNYVVGSSIEFCLNFRVLLYLMLPGFFIKMASRDRWLGLYTSLLPHLVCLSWWQMAVLASNGATYFGLIRSCLGVILMIIFLPLSSISSVLVPLLAVAKFLISEQISTALAISVISVSLIIYMGIVSKKHRRVFYLLQILLCLASVAFVLDTEEPVMVPKASLDWKDFSAICGSEDIKSQESCTKFVGLQVSWEGQVISTKLSSVSNPVASFINHLPQSLQGLATCILGEKLKDCESNGQDCSDESKDCRISNWNKYEYEIKVILGEEGWNDSNTIGWLRAVQTFRNFTLSIREGDRIWFSGLLGWKSNYGQPYVFLEKTKCLSCSSDQIHGELNTQPFLQLLIKQLLSFIFHPFVIFR